MRYLKIYVNGNFVQSIGCNKSRIARELNDYMDNATFINHFFDMYAPISIVPEHNVKYLETPQIVIYECSKSKGLKIPRIHKIYMIYSKYNFKHIKHTFITVNSDATSQNYPSEFFDRSVKEIIDFYTKNNKGIVSTFN